MSVIDEVKQKTDIIEVISQYTTLTKAGRTFRAHSLSTLTNKAGIASGPAILAVMSFPLL